MGMDAGIKVIFYDKENKVIMTDSMDCYKCSYACKSFFIPHGAKSVRVCFSTEYDKCNHSSDESSDDYSGDYCEEDEEDSNQKVDLEPSKSTWFL